MLKNTDLKSLIIGFLLAMVIMLTVGATNAPVNVVMPDEFNLSGSLLLHHRGTITHAGQIGTW